MTESSHNRRSPTDLTDRVALITGAGRGVGKGIALELARAGAHVAINYHESAAEAELTVNDARAFGVDAITVHADVGDERAVESMLDDVVARFGRIDTMVNNAGIQIWKPLLDVTLDEWERVIRTNLTGCFLGTRAAAQRMKETGGGSIVNIGSGSNMRAFPRLVAYTASKGGIEMFTKVAAVELGALRVRVNCVAPGAIEIERTREEDPNYASTWSSVTPLGRVGTPADIGRAVVFLASDESSFVTGQTLFVDGGLFTRPAWPYEDDARESRDTSQLSRDEEQRG